MTTTAESPRDARPYDLVLFGATGFTGRLVAEYLARRPSVGPGTRWAIAGRNPAKLAEVKASLARIEPKLAELPVLVCDSRDEASLEKVVTQTRVVCTTVGPYAVLGRELARACARHGTDYCDITGEVPFVRASIDENHAAAVASGARIVHACGFDAIPSDLGVHMVAGYLAKEDARRLARATSFFVMKGEFSGGTIASMMNLFEASAKDKALRSLLTDPYALVPNRETDRGPHGKDTYGVKHDDALGEWTAPFVMSAFNTRVVHRSNALAGHPYGKDFRYEELMSTGAGARGRFRATKFAVGLGSFMGVAATSPGRALLRKVLPVSGEGPSETARKNGYFRVRVVGESDATGGTPIRVLGRVEGFADPGYAETAKMVAESALCLAHDRKTLGTPFGVLTPATAMGDALVQHLRDAGMKFTVEPFEKHYVH
ncbi:MAG: saccharopine dehydrogenase NADP-binding domain-containing protein [Polyangiaceae bacterium]